MLKVDFGMVDQYLNHTMAKVGCFYKLSSNIDTIQEYERALCFSCDSLHPTDSWHECRQTSMKRKESYDQNKTTAPSS